VTAAMAVSRWMLASCLAFGSVMASGCSGSKVTAKSSAELPRYTVRSIALVPLFSIATPQMRGQSGPYLSTPQGIRPSDISVSMSPNVDPSLRQTMTVPPYASEKITQLFSSRLQHRSGLRIVPGAEAAKSLIGESPHANPEATGAATAKRLKVDAALIGEVLVYQERVGSRLGANPPASVGFEVKLVAADGQVLWVGNYYERQRAMNEDFIGFVQRWGAFVTAEELAQYGVEQVLKEFPFGGGDQ
jgi:hypothetical protein